RNRIESYLSRGREYYKNHFFEEAEKEFQKVLAVQPGHSEASELLNQCRKEIKDTQNKNKVSEYFNQVAKAYREENYGRALQILTDINRIDPENELIRKYMQVTRIKWDGYCDEYYNKARKMEEEGDFFLAKNFYIKVRNSNTNYKDIRFILDRFESKIDDYISSTRKEARALYAEKQYNESYVLWDRVSKLRPGDKEARRFVTLTASKAERIIQAEKLFGEGEKFFTDKKWKEALVRFNASLMLNPGLKNNYDAKYKRTCEQNIRDQLNLILNDGIRNYESGQYTNAMPYLTMVFQVAPENERARKYYQDARTRMDEISQGYYNRSKEYYQQNKLENAYQQIRLAIRYSPYNEEIRDFSKEIDGQYSKIRTEKDRKSKQDTDALLFEGIRLYRAGNLQEAIAKWKQVTYLDPNNAKAQDYIARAESKLKKLGGP
ncbi:MAG: tetratricopeptide repeat protein, partial [bacterium]|nr:tetratricopeptide repeat protein [bacterium]